MPTPAEEKRNLRQQIRRELITLGAPEVARLSRLIRKRLAAYIASNAEKKKGAPFRVAAFAARPFEVDLLPLVALLPEVEWYFPLCTGPHQMEFHRVTKTSDQLLPGYKGIREPSADAPLADPAQLDLVITPGVAFTRTGKRLGFGMGFYDALFPQSPNSLKVGVCFPCQVVDDIPSEEHDIVLDAIVVAGEGRNIDLAPTESSEEE